MTNVEQSAVQKINGWVRRAFSALGRVHARSVAMRELHSLDDRLLRDIGLRRDQVGITVDAMFRGDAVAETAQPKSPGHTPKTKAAEKRDGECAEEVHVYNVYRRTNDKPNEA